MNDRSIAERISGLDWPAIEEQLFERGMALTGTLLSEQECHALARLYAKPEGFRSRVVMARHGFGLGEYKYFDYPLPSIVADLRGALYPRLVPVANAWQQALGIEQQFPSTLDAMIRRCHDAGQTRPTPLLLKYQKGDYNCLHQDLYGEHVFPLQVVILLSQPGLDFTGGEFVLVEQRPRMQSKPQVVFIQQGEAVIFAVHHRPKQGVRGNYRVQLRHGVSEVRSGERYTSGIIFHDAA